MDLSTHLKIARGILFIAQCQEIKYALGAVPAVRKILTDQIDASAGFTDSALYDMSKSPLPATSYAGQKPAALIVGVTGAPISAEPPSKEASEEAINGAAVASSEAPTPSVTSGQQEPSRAVVVHAFTANKDVAEELTVKEGQEVGVTASHDDGWSEVVIETQTAGGKSRGIVPTPLVQVPQDYRG